jgi:small-conductance mechanosensitive channel
MKQDPPLGRQLLSTWSDFAHWIDDHTLSILVALAFGAVIVSLLYGLKLAGRWLARSETPWRSIAGRALRAMRFWFMAAVAAQIVSRYAHPPSELAELIRIFFVLAAGLQVTLILRELILGVIEVRAGEADPAGNLGSALGLIRLLVSVALFIVAAILILSNLGVNVTGLVAGLGIGGIAIGLAAQGIFADLFAALSILLDKPFRRGDLIRWENTVGNVEAIGLKSTRIRAMTGEEVVISNTNLLSKELRNLSRNERRRIVQPIALACQTDPGTCAALPARLETLVNAVPSSRFVRCTLETFNPGSFDFLLVYDVASEDQGEIATTKHAVNLAILKAFADSQIAFATPAAPATPPAEGKIALPKAAG